MNTSKIYITNPIIVGRREIYPIVKLSVVIIEDFFFKLNYDVVAIKIIENSSIYYKNISLSQTEFKKIKLGETVNLG